MIRDRQPQRNPRSKNSRLQSPLVSVVIPVYNCERYLVSSIDSVLHQSYEPIELIVVDDGSTDGSEEIIRHYSNLTAFRQSHKGVSAARNLGVSKASGEYIAFLDADDLWLEKKIESQVRFLKEKPGIGIVICKYSCFMEREDSPPPWIERDIFKKIRFGFIPSCLLCRRDVFDEVGMFDESYQTGEDLDWLARAKDAKKRIGRIDEVQVQKRYHGQNISYRDIKDRKHLLNIFKSSIQRKRQAADDVSK